ncbi:hypothetical protein A6V07_27380 [Escherichia coli]|nr:hypothetical protein A6V07_27380 [Escherichia coli]
MFHTIVSIKNDGHYFCRAGGNRPDGLNEPVTVKYHDRRKKIQTCCFSIAPMVLINMLFYNDFVGCIQRRMVTAFSAHHSTSAQVFALMLQ